MKQLSLIASALAVLGVTACEKPLDVMDDEMSSDFGQVKNSLLQVWTKAGGVASNEATVAYPVTVYVFQGDECKAAQTIGDEGQTLNIALTERTYSVDAIGGASTEDYVVPSASEALMTSAIVLREGKSHGDLMTAKANVVLSDGEANTVTLGMERRTMLLQSVVMKKYLFIVLSLLVASCEKPILDENLVVERGANVILYMTQFEQTTFTRSATDITELCTRLNIAIFDANGIFRLTADGDWDSVNGYTF